MLSKVFSAAVSGIDGFIIDVEVDVASGLPSYTTVGLPDSAVRESRERVRAAVRNSGFEFPTRNITVSLAPADLRKEGSALDLPIAVGIVAPGLGLDEARLARCCLLGELSLDGRVKSVRGALSMTARARDHGFAEIILPQANAREAAMVEGIVVRPASTLLEVVAHLGGDTEIPAFTATQAETPNLASAAPHSLDADYADVRGQAHAKRALEVAAAGGHHILMVGPPGSGKTMLARRLPTILPPLSREESLSTTKIYSVVGLLGASGLIRERPFRAPHHTVSYAGLVGGGTHARPGEVSLAHHGVLFLDEMPEFPRHVLEVLRQPLEEGVVRISRASGCVAFPARFMLAAAMNPCPCGHLGHPIARCVCDPASVARYRSRISGPLFDRIDLHVEVPAVAISELVRAGTPPTASSAAIQSRVLAARDRQRQRLGPGRSCNSQMSAAEISRDVRLDPAGRSLMESAANRLGFSARAFDRTLKLARTIADLEDSDKAHPHHLAEALQYRSH